MLTSRKYTEDSSVNQDLAAKNVLNISFWDLCNVSASQYGEELDQLIRTYNTKCPTKTITDSLGRIRTYQKGKLRAPQINLARKLFYLCAQQMEEMRKNSDSHLQKRYLRLMTDDTTDALPVMTNRGVLKAALGGANCKSSLWAHLKQLEDAGIILSKSNTSRRRTEEMNDNGKKTVIVQLCANGRGDFEIWLNVRLFCWYILPEVWESPHFLKIKNTGFQHPQIQNLEQSIHIKKETKLSIEKNLSGGAIAPTSSFAAGSSEPEQQNRNDEGKLREIAAAAPKNPPPPAIFAIAAAENEQRKYEDSLRLDREVRRMIPEGMKDQEYYLMVVYKLMIELLYSTLNINYLKHIKPEIFGLLSIHLKRLTYLGNSEIEAATIISRAVQAAHQWLHDPEHPERYLYEPITWLRTDGEYTKGTLLYLLDNQILKQDKRLAVKKDENRDLVAWQEAVLSVDHFYKNLLYTLREKGFTVAKAGAKETMRCLEAYFFKKKSPESVRIKARLLLQDMCNGLLNALEKPEAINEEEMMKILVNEEKRKAIVVKLDRKKQPKNWK